MICPQNPLSASQWIFIFCCIFKIFPKKVSFPFFFTFQIDAQWGCGLLTAEGNPSKSALPEDFKQACMALMHVQAYGMPQQNRLKVLFGQCGVDSVQLQVLCCRIWMHPFDLTFSRSISLTSLNLTHVQTQQISWEFCFVYRLIFFSVGHCNLYKSFCHNMSQPQCCIRAWLPESAESLNQISLFKSSCVFTNHVRLGSGMISNKTTYQDRKQH